MLFWPGFWHQSINRKHRPFSPTSCLITTMLIEQIEYIYPKRNNKIGVKCISSLIYDVIQTIFDYLCLRVVREGGAGLRGRENWYYRYYFVLLIFWRNLLSEYLKLKINLSLKLCYYSNTIFPFYPTLRHFEFIVRYTQFFL